MGEQEILLELEHCRRRIAQLEGHLQSASLADYRRSVFDDLFEGVQIVDSQTRYVYLNKTALRHARRSSAELIGRSMEQCYPGIEKTEVFALILRCLRERTAQNIVNHFVYPDGQKAWFELRINPVPSGAMVYSIDISKQRAAEEELRQSRADLAATMECMAEAVIASDVNGRVVRMNPAAEALTGWSDQEARGQLLDDLVRFFNQHSGAQVDHPVQKVIRDGAKIGLANDTVLLARDGRRIPIASSGAPIRDAAGALRGVVMVIKNMKEEYELIAMLQQAQKMEAIGRLAGGIAHDFNNILMVITGYSEMLLQPLPQRHPQREALEQINQAGYHAASLTRQLLAFSRKQILQPQILDLNEAVARMDKMLQRVIGEDVDLITRLGQDLHLVRCDPGQLEQIVLNLAVNARDAMPQGGKLTIETANVQLDENYAASHPGAQVGPHVMLAVSDTGVGMDADTKSRLFEPFFTTKEPGKGTGLGLSTVYGIVKQSGGNIWVYSELGRGTTFKIYLPAAAGAVVRQPTVRADLTATAGQTILIVEDEAPLLTLLEKVLRGGGYQVLSAGDGETAMARCREHDGPIHLLLTDVVLPGLGGKPLADRAQALRPEMKVVFMSGYTDNAIVHSGVLDPGVAFVEKPISPDALLAKLREYLG